MIQCAGCSSPDREVCLVVIVTELGMIEGLGSDIGTIGRWKKNERSLSASESVLYAFGASASKITYKTYFFPRLHPLH